MASIEKEGVCPLHVFSIANHKMENKSKVSGYITLVIIMLLGMSVANITTKKGRIDKSVSQKKKIDNTKEKNNVNNDRTEKLTLSKNMIEKVPAWLKIVLCFVFIATIIVIYVFIVKKRLFYLLYKKEIQNTSSNSEMVLIARKYMAKYMGRYGRQIEMLPDNEYIEKLSGICDTENLGEILEKAAFAKKDISKNELFDCLDIMNKIALKIRDEKSLHYLVFELNLIQNFIIEKAK